MIQSVIWWVRRDLRLADNQALAAALAAAPQVIPLFILDPFFERSAYVAEKRRAFLWQGLHQLDDSLRRRGSRLIVRRGEPVTVLAKIAAENGAEAIFAEEDFSGYARRRDRLVAQQLPLHLVDGLTVHPPATLLKPTGQAYTVFTPFKKAWLARPLPTPADLLPPPGRINTPADLASEAIPDLPISSPFLAGEDEAGRRLHHFTAGRIYQYSWQRNDLAGAGTSQLSPYLRFGMVSLRQAAAQAVQAIRQAQDHSGRQAAESWLSELIWREFYLTILYHFPQVLGRSFRPELENIAWRNDPAEFAAWCQGRTGYPVVDAAMRQLSQTGWLPNRARMIVASFLVKDLLISWQWGERWFMQQLIDGDPATNNGGWQWTAGTGTDAAPYFRVFNPPLQSMKFDPAGSYLRRYLPELANVPLAYLHTPWQMPPSMQQQAGCIIGRDYPAPLVNHQTSRATTLAVYRLAKEENRQNA